MLIAAMIVVACTSKIESYEGKDIAEWEEEIVNAHDNNLYIDSVNNKDDSVIISLSSGKSISLSRNSLLFISIGVDGYWYINGEKSDFPLTGYKGEDVLKSIPLSSFNYGGVVEDFTRCTFVFNSGTVVPLIKTLYSYDADHYLRGVNHRGYNITAPENTLPAFILSRLRGFKYVETDVRFTSDGIPVLLHDETVDRTSNGNGKIRDLSFDEVRKLDFGSWKASEYEGTPIPTFEEFLSLCRDIGLEPNIELKLGTKEQIQQLVDLVEEYGLKGKATYISFSLQLLKYVVEKDPRARVGFVSSRVNDSVVQNAISLRTGENEVYVGSADYSDNTILLCKSAGLPLSVYVINTVELVLSLPSYVSSVTSNGLHAGRVIYEARYKNKS